jgi:iron complex outermembrane receptor protein
MNVPLPPDAIARMEVLRGSGSTLYGSDAVGGAVNFLTESPDNVRTGWQEIRLRAAIGSFGTNQQSGSMLFGWKGVSEQLAFSRDFSTGFEPNRDYRNLSLSSVTRGRTRLGWTEVVLALNDRPFGADQFYGNFPSWERTKAWFASARQQLGKRTEAAYGFRRHTDLFVLYRDRPQIYTNRHATESHQAAIRRTDELADNVRLHYGGDGLYDVIDSNNLGHHSRGRGAAYASLDVRALKRFSFAIGAREEVYTKGTAQFNPSASAGVWLSPHLKLRASASRAFRLPTYTDLYYRDPATTGNPNLRPEKAWTFDGGADWTHGRWHAEGTVFHRREQDGIDYVRQSLTEPWRAANFQRLRFTGVETSVDVRLAGPQWIDVRYTGIRGERDLAENIYSRYVFSYPVHNGSIGWQAAIPGGFLARARIGVLERLNRDPYTLFDAGLAWNRHHWTPYIQFTNIADVQYQEIQGVNMPGRAVLAGIEWRRSR